MIRELGLPRDLNVLLEMVGQTLRMARISYEIKGSEYSIVIIRQEFKTKPSILLCMLS